MIKSRLRFGRSLCAISLLASAGLSLPIDNWEPLKTGTAIPSATRQSTILPNQVWMGYSNGDLYMTTEANNPAPNWNRLDSANDGHGGIVNVAPGLAITSVAPVSNFDGFSAFVSFGGTQQGYKFWRVDWNRGGLTWTDLTSRLPVGGDIWNVSINPRAGIIYVVTGGGVAYSVDNGATFTTTRPSNDPYQPPTEGAVSAVANNPATEQAVVGTTNGEVWLGSQVTPPWTPTWTKISTGRWGTLPRQVVSSVAIDTRDLDGKSFYASFGGRTDNSVWVTRTGGQFWNSIHNPNIPIYSAGFGAIVDDISVPLATGATSLYAMTEYGPFRSDDNGSTWFSTPRWSGFNLAAEYRHLDRSVINNQLYVSVRFRNLGSVPVAPASARFGYRYTSEFPGADRYLLDYVAWPYTARWNISNSGTERILETTMNTQGASVAPGTVSGEIQGRVTKADWSWTNFDQSNDFSYLVNATDWTLNPFVGLWIGDRQVWGAFGRSMALPQ